MRKSTLKKSSPNRHKIIKFLKEKNYLTEVMSRKGTPIYLNLMKHLLFRKPYTNSDYNNELLRFAKHNTGAKKEVKEEVKDEEFKGSDTGSDKKG